ncbi:MAG: beta-propeller fold lactonase family protein [Nocardioidaceae bacterium]|nr:beta-propeller fold lactonase family protein [Nocardioidaceae bacterium]
MVFRVKKMSAGALSLITLASIGPVAQVQASGTQVQESGTRAQELAAQEPISDAQIDGDLSRHGPRTGAAFAMTNRSTRNEIITYRRAANGSLTRVGRVSTRGKGIGTDLDTQGGLQLARKHRFLYAVNAGSDTISVFSVKGTHLTFRQRIYAGDEPTSLTVHRKLLYVLDSSVAGNGILGFRIAADGTLRPIAHSERLLSSPIAVPGQVEFSPDGRFLVVTHKTTNVLVPPKNAIDVFRVRSDGLASAVPKREASHGVRPFSLAFRKDRQLLVVESFNAADNASGVSSYRMTEKGALKVISGSVRNRQTDSCWVVITRNNRYAFVANFGSGTISSYRFTSTGKVRLIDGKAAFLGINSQPVDLDLAAKSHYLYLLLRGSGKVASFKIQDDGGLSSRGVVKGGLPVADGASGLSVY